jgi:hypothetical protein
VPAVSLSRAGARVVGSGADGVFVGPDTWARLEALPDPRSPRGLVVPGRGRGVRVDGGRSRPGERDRAVGPAGRSGGPGAAAGAVGPVDRSPTGSRTRRRPGWCWTVWTPGR